MKSTDNKLPVGPIYFNYDDVRRPDPLDGDVNIEITADHMNMYKTQQKLQKHVAVIPDSARRYNATSTSQDIALDSGVTSTENPTAA